MAVEERCFFFVVKKSSSEGRCTESFCDEFRLVADPGPGEGGVFDLVVKSELEAEPSLIDGSLWSSPSLGSEVSSCNRDPRTNVPDCEFALLKSPDITFLIRLDEEVGRLRRGDLGDRGGVVVNGSFLSSDDVGGVADVFRINGVCL